MPWCHQCGYEYVEGTMVCPDCGSALRQEPPGRCPKCGYHYEEGESVCPECGTPVGMPVAATRRPTATSAEQTDMVPIYYTSNLARAQVVRAQLMGAGVPAFIQGEHTPEMGLEVSTGRYRVMMSRKIAEEHRDLIVSLLGEEKPSPVPRRTPASAPRAPTAEEIVAQQMQQDEGGCAVGVAVFLVAMTCWGVLWAVVSLLARFGSRP